MLDMGFIEDVETIIKHCPKTRQTFLFSATISSDVEHIAMRHMINPIDIAAEQHVDPSKLRQIFYDVPTDRKFSLLVHLLKHEKGGAVMIFCNTRHNADFVAYNLKLNRINATAIHGGLTQSKRTRIMEAFKSSGVHALVCTDIAARGLDIEGVSHVYNYDSPPNSKDYIHRIGRTARAGKEGIAITIVSQRDYNNFNEVLKDSSLNIKQEKLPENIERAFMQIHIPRGRRERKAYGGRFEGRGERRFGGRREHRGREEGRSRGRFEGRGEGRKEFRGGGESRGFRGRGERFGRSGGQRGDGRGRFEGRSERGSRFGRGFREKSRGRSFSRGRRY